MLQSLNETNANLHFTTYHGRIVSQAIQDLVDPVSDVPELPDDGGGHVLAGGLLGDHDAELQDTAVLYGKGDVGAEKETGEYAKKSAII